MPVNNPKELFVQLLSGLRQGTERSTKIYQELSKFAEDPDVKEALEARAFVSEKVLGYSGPVLQPHRRTAHESQLAPPRHVRRRFSQGTWPRYKTQPQSTSSSL